MEQSSILILLASCQQNFMTYNSAVCIVKNSWWWTEELSETCRVSFQNKFEKLVIWFFYHKEFITMHGHMDVKPKLKRFQYSAWHWHFCNWNETVNQVHSPRSSWAKCCPRQSGKLTAETFQLRKGSFQPISRRIQNRTPRQLWQLMSSLFAENVGVIRFVNMWKNWDTLV
jgi:hypothetical protein